jgi:hypothetical protein
LAIISNGDQIWKRKGDPGDVLAKQDGFTEVESLADIYIDAVDLTEGALSCHI